jgi:hypothetical protein
VTIETGASTNTTSTPPSAGADATAADDLIARSRTTGGAIDMGALAEQATQRANGDPNARASIDAALTARMTPVERGEYAAATQPPGGSEEGVGSFFEGAIKGDFGNNDSWSATAGQVAMGFVPIAGQIADARDTAAAVGQVWNGEAGGWTNLLAAGVGWVPGLGDGLKAAIRGGDRLADAGGEVAETAVRRSDNVAADAAATVARERIVMDGGRKGDWPAELNARELRPNADYVVNGYTYRTDAQGRVTGVEGDLDLSVADRNGYQQRVSGREDRLPDDQGGHLIASIFNGPGDRLNLVPMNGNFNMGAWRDMERSFETALQEGKAVDVRIDVIYSANGARPDGFVVNSTVDGVARTDTFFNRPGG